MEEGNRHCLNCGTPLAGRIDKKFCNDNCRAMYNNRQYRQRHAAVSHIDRILKKNRYIIDRLYSAGERYINIDKLRELGFNFHYLTSIHIDQMSPGSCILSCYEYNCIISRCGSIEISRTSRQDA